MKRESPVERYPGHVILPEFLNVLQVRMFEDAYFGDPNDREEKEKKVYVSVSDEKMLPVLFKTVSEWHLENIPENPTIETFPMTPAKDGHALVMWLSGEVYKMYAGETDIPNE